MNEPLYTDVRNALLAGQCRQLQALIEIHQLPHIVLTAETVIASIPPSHYWQRRIAETTWGDVAIDLNQRRSRHPADPR